MGDARAFRVRAHPEEHDPFYGLRRTRPRRRVMAVSASAAQIHRDHPPFAAPRHLPQSSGTDRPLSTAPEHVEDLFLLTRKAGMKTVSQENGLEKVVAFVPRPILILKISLSRE